MSRRWLLVVAVALVVLALLGVIGFVVARSCGRSVRYDAGATAVPRSPRSPDSTLLPVGPSESDSGSATEFAGLSVMAYEGYAVTRGRYAEAEDLAAAAQEEFGWGAEVADWQVIKELFAGRSREFADAVGLYAGLAESVEGVFVRNGETYVLPVSSRHYYMCCCGGDVLPSEIHDRFNGRFCLRSGAALRMPILVRLPPKK